MRACACCHRFKRRHELITVFLFQVNCTDRRFGHILRKSIDNQLYLTCLLYRNRWKMSYAEHLLEKMFGLDHLHDFELVSGKDGQR